MNKSINYRLTKTVLRLPQDVQGSRTTWSHHAAFGDIYLDPCTSQPTYTGCPAGGWLKQTNVFDCGVSGTAFPHARFCPSRFPPPVYCPTHKSCVTGRYEGSTSTGLHSAVSGSSA